MSRLIRPTSLRLPNDIERHTTWLEIFFDLIFAVIVVQLSDRLSTHFSLMEILKCSALFVPAMWTWANHTVFAARFDNDDAVHWLMTFVIMFAGAIMAIQIPTALEEGATGYSIGFLLAQMSILLLYGRTLYDHASPQHMAHFYLMGFGLGGVFWVISLFFNPPEKFIFWFLGMCTYLSIPWIGRKRILFKAPLDPMYIPERFGSFTIIILGQIVASVVFGLQSAHWDPSSIITSIMAFALAILIWSQYYRFTQIADYKCTLGSGQPYIYAHIPLIISLIIIGVCTQHFISSEDMHELVKIVYCYSLISYLLSFYLLQYIAMHRYKIRGLYYLGGITALLALFFIYPLSHMVIMIGIVIIFAALFAFQYWLGYYLSKQSGKC